MPTRHPNGSDHVGQPVPAYRTVLLAVKPQVVMVSVPPRVTVSPRNREKTMRDPG